MPDRLTVDPAVLIRAVERLERGEHLCMVYENREHQLVTAAAFIRLGLERGERCLYIVDDNTAEAVLAAARQAGIRVDAALRTGALVIAEPRDTYLRDGSFDPDAMVRLLTEAVLAAEAAGYSALRATGEMTWVLGESLAVDRLVEYEARMTRAIRETRVVALCQYHRGRFGGTILQAVLETHPDVVFGGLVCRNPYYVPPEEFLNPDADAEVGRLLQNLVDRQRVEEQLRAGHAQLQSVSRQLVEAQETERREIARELHDEIGQLLTGVKLGLERVLGTATADTARQLGELEPSVTELLNRVRDLSLDLRPVMLDELGLVPTLRWYVDRYRQRTGVNVTTRVEITHARRFRPSLEMAAFRIIQEALTNVARHAQVGEATILLRADEYALHLSVEDRGVGFDGDVSGHAGVVGMRERAVVVGGTLRIEASSGTGVRVMATLPRSSSAGEGTGSSG